MLSDTGIVSDSNNIFIRHESEDINKTRLFSKSSLDFNFTFTSYAWLMRSGIAS